MKRFILLCAIVLSLGMAETATAEQFGIFNSNGSLSGNLSTAFPGEIFITFDYPELLKQYLFPKLLFASDEAIAAGGYIAAQIDAWSNNSDTQQSYYFWDLQFLSGSTLYTFQDLLSGIAFYTGSGLEYTPDSGLDTLLISGGTLLVAISLPGNGNAVDAIFALAANPFDFKAAQTPAPAAALLLGTGIFGIIAARRHMKN